MDGEWVTVMVRIDGDGDGAELTALAMARVSQCLSC